MLEFLLGGLVRVEGPKSQEAHGFIQPVKDYALFLHSTTFPTTDMKEDFDLDLVELLL